MRQGEPTSFRPSIQERINQGKVPCLLWHEWISVAQPLSIVDGHMIENCLGSLRQTVRHHSRYLLRIDIHQRHPKS